MFAKIAVINRFLIGTGRLLPYVHNLHFLVPSIILCFFPEAGSCKKEIYEIGLIGEHPGKTLAGIFGDLLFF